MMLVMVYAWIYSILFFAPLVSILDQIQKKMGEKRFFFIFFCSLTFSFQGKPTGSGKGENFRGIYFSIFCCWFLSYGSASHLFSRSFVCWLVCVSPEGACVSVWCLYFVRLFVFSSFHLNTNHPVARKSESMAK